jgi:hypothetical protein
MNRIGRPVRTGTEILKGGFVLEGQKQREVLAAQAQTTPGGVFLMRLSNGASPHRVSPGDFFPRGNFGGNQTTQKYSNNRHFGDS